MSEDNNPICMQCVHSRVQADIQTLPKLDQFQALMSARCALSIAEEITLVIGQKSMDTCLATRMDSTRCGKTGHWFESQTVVDSVPKPVMPQGGNP